MPLKQPSFLKSLSLAFQVASWGAPAVVLYNPRFPILGSGGSVSYPDRRTATFQSPFSTRGVTPS